MIALVGGLLESGVNEECGRGGLAHGLVLCFTQPRRQFELGVDAHMAAKERVRPWPRSPTPDPSPWAMVLHTPHGEDSHVSILLWAIGRVRFGSRAIARRVRCS